MLFTEGFRSRRPLDFVKTRVAHFTLFIARHPVIFFKESNNFFMPLRAETLNLLKELERSSHRPLQYRENVGNFLEAAQRTEKMKEFEDVLFLAKFITKSFGVMKRIGADGEGYDKLSAEFEANLRKVTSLLQDISNGMSEGDKQAEEKLFFGLTSACLDHLVQLMADLTVLKNWTLDGNPLPQA